MERLEQRPTSNNIGLYAFHCRLASIRHQILSTTRRYKAGTNSNMRMRLEPSQVMEDVNKLQLKISGFVESLPMVLRLSDNTIEQYFQSGDRPSFVMLHTWIGQMYIDLYRFSLPGLDEQTSPELLAKLPADFIKKSQKQAIAHAISLARFWEHMQHRIQMEFNTSIITTDSTLAICVVQCTNVLVSARKYDLYKQLCANSTAPLWRAEEVTTDIIERLINSNLRVIQHLAHCIPRIRTFEEAVSRKVEELRQWKDEENKRLELPSNNCSSDPLRLPGPHYLLNGGSSSGDNYTNSWLTRPPSDPNCPLPRPLFAPGVFSPKKQDEFCTGPPSLPFILAQARSIDPCKPSTAAINISPSCPADVDHLEPHPVEITQEHKRIQNIGPTAGRAVTTIPSATSSQIRRSGSLLMPPIQPDFIDLQGSPPLGSVPLAKNTSHVRSDSGNSAYGFSQISALGILPTRFHG